MLDINKCREGITKYSKWTRTKAAKGKLTGNEVRNISGSQMAQGLLCYCKDLFSFSMKW